MIGGSVVRRPARSGLLVAVAVVAATSACTSDGDGSSGGGGADPVPIERSVLAEELAVEFTGDHPTRSARRDGRCFAGELLDRIGPAQLRSAGLLDEDGHLVDPLPDLSGRVATTWVAAQQECSDFVESSAAALFAQSKGKLDRGRYTDCLERALTEEEIRAGLVAAITGDLQGEAVAAISQAQAQCAQRALPQG